MKSLPEIPVVDLFAGPGGLGEGFSSFRAEKDHPFRIGLSIEMDKDAHSTLELRSFFRKFRSTGAPSSYYKFLRGEITRDALFEAHPREAAAAKHEAWLARLGDPEVNRHLNGRIKEAIGDCADWVLCGGPPCQAYSIVGRSRTGGIDAEDHRVYLYKEYLNILASHEPPVFIMENVKGLLSSRVSGNGIFHQLLEDLHSPAKAVGQRGRNARYRIWSLVQEPRAFSENGDPCFEHNEFVIKCELFGIPQSRHRVILLGVREDRWLDEMPLLPPAGQEIAVSRVLHGLPRLRSGLSREPDSPEHWRSALAETLTTLSSKAIPNGHGPDMQRALSEIIAGLTSPNADRGGNFVRHRTSVNFRPDWFLDAAIEGVCNHESRPHMRSDLQRYLYSAVYAELFDQSPELKDFPKVLLPAHKNVEVKGKEKYFDDRFRVQLSNRPSMTVTCHIAKDGHYYIHPDPSQCRTFTVREAARVQTFPDNYFFCGTRTAQYRQVGNAVPPLLAIQIAGLAHRILQGKR